MKENGTWGATTLEASTWRRWVHCCMDALLHHFLDRDGLNVGNMGFSGHV